MNILIAPNAFKNSLPATEVADAIYKGFSQSTLNCSCTCFPVGDGGDGTAALLVKNLNAVTKKVEVHDPLKRKITSPYSITTDGKTAIIELADASGLRLLQIHEYDPLIATTYGTGELIKKALDEGVEKIIVGIGGSATVDGGMGILQAIGLKFLDDQKKEVQIPEQLIHLETIDTSELDERIRNVELMILCDVENTLLGDEGAAKVFGPQKGATEEMVQKLEASLAQLRKVVFEQTAKDMSIIKSGGAAGGAAAGLATMLNAKLVNGIDYFLDATRFDEALNKTDIVITGEGSIDEQTLQGKAPFGVAKRAKEKNITVIGVSGKIPAEVPAFLQQYFDILIPVNNEAQALENAIKTTYTNLIRTGKMLGDLMAIKKKEVRKIELK